jgi:hypothetical protein
MVGAGAITVAGVVTAGVGRLGWGLALPRPRPFPTMGATIPAGAAGEAEKVPGRRVFPAGDTGVTEITK